MKNFNTIYQELYRTHFTTLSNLKKNTFRLQIVLWACLLFAFFLFYLRFSHPVFRLTGTVFAILLAVLIGSIRSTKFVHYYKKNVIKSIIHSYDDTFNYYPESPIPSSIYCEAEFERYFDRYTSDDKITGQWRDFCSLLMGEVKTEVRYTDEDGHTSYSTIFSGLFIKIEFPKFLPCTIKVRKNATFKRSYTNSSSGRKNILSLPTERIEMDSPDFEKLYDVYSDNPILTMQLFTSDIMQMLLDFKQNYGIFPEITMKQNCLYLRFSVRKKLFEPNWYKRVLDYTDTQNHYTFIHSIMNLSDSLLKNSLEVEW